MAKRKKAKKKPPPPPTSSKKNQVRFFGYLLLVLGAGMFLYYVVAYNFTQDDAYITFRYAANYLDGHGLVYNYGERVEGFTNFLWTIIMILGGALGIDFVLFSKLLGTLCGLGILLTLFLMAQSGAGEKSKTKRIVFAGLCCLVLGLVYSFAYWAVAGLETAAFSLMVLLSLFFYLRRSPVAFATLVLATLLRPEGGLVFFFILIYEIVTNRQVTRYAVYLFVIYGLFLLPLAVFKQVYYGSIFPNPFFAKTSFTLQQLINGASYTGRFFWHYLAAGAFLVPALIRIKNTSPTVRLSLVFLLIYTLYITLIGGDVLKVHRFFVPLLPLFALVIVYGLWSLVPGRRIGAIGVVVVVAWCLYVPSVYVSTFYRMELGLAEKMDKMADQMLAHDDSNFTLAVSTIGMIGYKLLGHTVIDMLGLTDSTIARHPEPAPPGLETTWRETHFNSKYLLSRQPDYILFSTGSKPSAPAERALFLYSAFLNSYRTIGFFFMTRLHVVYKRYYPITLPVERDVDVNFVQYYNKGINLQTRKTTPQAMDALETALAYSPEPKYPYVYYYMSEAQRKSGNINKSYIYLRTAAELDTLIYEVYKDLYYIEYRMENYEVARRHRQRVASLVPWYIPRLDSLVTGVR